MSLKPFYLLASATLISSCATIPDSCQTYANNPNYAKYAAASNDAWIKYVTKIDIPELQCLSDQNNPAAMVELGRRLETSAGSANTAKAIKLYRRAMTPISASTAIYSPPVTLGGRGQVIFIANPKAGLGSAEAKYRLGKMYLDGRGFVADQDRGWSLIGDAATQGFAPALEALARRSSQ